MANNPHEWDMGWEYFYEQAPSRRRLLTFGFALSPWQTVPYVEYSSLGKFEGDRFDPRAWRPQTPTTAYMELRDDDAFWAALKMAAFTDELIRAVVHTANFSDPAAEKHLADVLIERRDKIKSSYLTAVNPVVHPRLAEDGRLTFANAAFDAGVASGAATYIVSWARFDNTTGEARPLSETRSATTTVDPPPDLPAAPGAFIAADIAVESATYPVWQRPVRTYFTRERGGWKLVGLEREPEKTTSAAPDRQ
jgi:hypothetical protein